MERQILRTENKANKRSKPGSTNLDVSQMNNLESICKLDEYKIKNKAPA